MGNTTEGRRWEKYFRKNVKRDIEKMKTKIHPSIDQAGLLFVALCGCVSLTNACNNSWHMVTVMV